MKNMYNFCSNIITIMRQYNIFDRDSDYAGFAKAAYKILMSHMFASLD